MHSMNTQILGVDRLMYRGGTTKNRRGIHDTVMNETQVIKLRLADTTPAKETQCNIAMNFTENVHTSIFCGCYRNK